MLCGLMVGAGEGAGGGDLFDGDVFCCFLHVWAHSVAVEVALPLEERILLGSGQFGTTSVPFCRVGVIFPDTLVLSLVAVVPLAVLVTVLFEGFEE